MFPLSLSFLLLPSSFCGADAKPSSATSHFCVCLEVTLKSSFLCSLGWGGKASVMKDWSSHSESRGQSLLFALSPGSAQSWCHPAVPSLGVSALPCRWHQTCWFSTWLHWCRGLLVFPLPAHLEAAFSLPCVAPG